VSDKHDPIRLLATALADALDQALHGGSAAKNVAQWEQLLRGAIEGPEPLTILCMDRDLVHVMETSGVIDDGSYIETTDTHVRFRMTRGMWLPA
jgi:hypothetical protein